MLPDDRTQPAAPDKPTLGTRLRHAFRRLPVVLKVLAVIDAIFLSGPFSSYITGQTIHVDGGTHAAAGWYHHPQTGAYSLGPQ